MRPFLPPPRVSFSVLLAFAACPGPGRNTPADRAPVLAAQCAAALQRGALDEAQSLCEHALEFDADHSNAWNNLGVIRQHRGDLPAAKAAFIRAVRSDNEHAQAYNNLGDLSLRESDFSTAAERFERALQVNPDYAEARYNLGVARYRGGERDEAKKQFLRLTLVHPELADGHNFLALLALEDKDWSQAIQLATRAVELDQNYAGGWQNLGLALLGVGRREDAKAAFESCLLAEPENAACRQSLAALEH